MFMVKLNLKKKQDLPKKIINPSRNIKSLIDHILQRQENVEVSKIPPQRIIYDGLSTIICNVNNKEYTEVNGCPFYHNFVTLVNTNHIHPKKTCLNCQFYDHILSAVSIKIPHLSQ